VYTCIGACIPLSIYFLYPEVGLPFFLGHSHTRNANDSRLWDEAWRRLI
jgi:hypothetical protein